MSIDNVIKKYNLKSLGGDNQFGGVFSARSWSAPIIQRPIVLREYLDAIGIIGATLENIYFIDEWLTISGMNCPESKKTNKIGEKIYDKERLAWLVNFRDKLYFDTHEPVILSTDKGNFEIDYSESSTILMSKDLLPCSLYQNNYLRKDVYNTKKVFSNIIGKKIVAIDIEEKDYKMADDDFTGSYGIELPPDQDSYIQSMILILEDGMKIVFSSRFDDAYITLKDSDGNDIEVSGYDLIKFSK